MLLRLILGFFAAMLVARFVRGLFGTPAAPPGEPPRSKRVPTDLDPRHKVEARWSEVEREEGTPED